MSDSYIEPEEERKERVALEMAIKMGDIHDFKRILTNMDPGNIMEFIEESLKYGQVHIADYLMSLEIVSYDEIMDNDHEDVDEGVLDYCISKGYISDNYLTDPLFRAITCGYKDQAEELL